MSNAFTSQTREHVDPFPKRDLLRPGLLRLSGGRFLHRAQVLPTGTAPRDSGSSQLLHVLPLHRVSSHSLAPAGLLDPLLLRPAPSNSRRGRHPV